MVPTPAALKQGVLTSGLPESPREFCFLSSDIPNALVWETENICVYFYF